MLLRQGRVYPKPTTWTAEHRRWLSAQQFDEPASDLVFADLIASVDGLIARKQAMALQLSELVTDERLVADRRAAAGVPRDRHADRVLRCISSSAPTGSALRPRPRSQHGWD